MVGVAIYWMIGIAAITVLIGWFLKVLLEKWLTEREASIASFSWSLGGLPVALLFNLRLDSVSTTEALGSLVGSCILWWMLFRRTRS